MSELVGLDIGSYTLKLVKLDRKGKGYDLAGWGASYNPVGQVLPADRGQWQQLVVALKQLVGEYKVSGKQIVVALPDTLAYVSIILMPALSDAELSSAIKWEAEQHIPVPLDQVNLEYEVLKRPKKGATEEKMEVLLVAAQKEMVNRLSALINEAGMETIAVETEMMAAVRALWAKKVNVPTSLICHFGATSAALAVIYLDRLALVHTVPIGGLALTRAVETGLGLDSSRAEEYKRTYGLDPQHLEGKLRGVMVPVMEKLVTELRKTMQFFSSQHGGAAVKRMALSGGSAHLPGLPAYMTQTLGVEVIVGNPFEGMGNKKLPADYAAFSVAVGLAVRGNM